MLGLGEQGHREVLTNSSLPGRDSCSPASRQGAFRVIQLHPRYRCGIHDFQRRANTMIVVRVHVEEQSEPIAGSTQVIAGIVLETERLDRSHARSRLGKPPPRHVFAIGLGNRIPWVVASRKSCL